MVSAVAMGARKRAYLPKCQDCRRGAAFEVRDGFNKLIGIYCGEHADALVKSLNDYQAAMDQETNSYRR